MDSTQFFNDVIAHWERLIPSAKRPMVAFEIEIDIDDQELWCINYQNRVITVKKEMADDPMIAIGMNGETWGYIKERYLKHQGEIPNSVDEHHFDTQRFINGINGLKKLNGMITFQDRLNKNRRMMLMIGEPLPSDPSVVLTGDESLFDHIGSISSVSALLTSGQVKMTGNVPFLMKIAALFMKR